MTKTSDLLIIVPLPGRIDSNRSKLIMTLEQGYKPRDWLEVRAMGRSGTSLAETEHFTHRLLANSLDTLAMRLVFLAGGFEDLERTAKTRLGVAALALSNEERTKIVRAIRDPDVIRTERLLADGGPQPFADGKRSTGEGLRLFEATLFNVQIDEATAGVAIGATEGFSGRSVYLASGITQMSDR